MMKYITMIPLKFTNKELHTGDTFIPKNEDAIKGLLAEGKVRPLSEVMSDKYQTLTDWLHRFDLTRDEIKDALPGRYQDIQDQIQRLDDAFIIEDITAFQNALDRVKSLYAEALLKCGRKIAVKVYSEILQAYLWVVDTDRDMHSLRSQGITEAIYTANEIRKLKGLGKDSLKEIHKVKEVFPESIVDEIKDGKQN